MLKGKLFTTGKNNWKKLDEDRLMLESSQKTRQTKLDLAKFQEYLEENPTKFNREIGEVFGIKKSSSQMEKEVRFD